MDDMTPKIDAMEWAKEAYACWVPAEIIGEVVGRKAATIARWASRHNWPRLKKHKATQARASRIMAKSSRVDPLPKLNFEDGKSAGGKAAAKTGLYAGKAGGCSPKVRVDNKSAAAGNAVATTAGEEYDELRGLMELAGMYTAEIMAFDNAIKNEISKASDAAKKLGLEEPDMVVEAIEKVTRTQEGTNMGKPVSMRDVTRANKMVKLPQVVANLRKLKVDTMARQADVHAKIAKVKADRAARAQEASVTTGIDMLAVLIGGQAAPAE